MFKKNLPSFGQHHLKSVHDHGYTLPFFLPFHSDVNYCKSIKRFLSLYFHCEFHFSVYSMHTEYDSLWQAPESMPTYILTLLT